jgi:hypothetical protein
MEKTLVRWFSESWWPYWVAVIAAIAVLLQLGCRKEYSYEWQPEKIDTVAALPIDPSSPVTACDACKTAVLPDSSWRLTYNGIVYCGRVEKAIIAPERTAFTFFGPSFCSPDSGFVATIYLGNEQLNTDRSNVPAKMAVYYYDHVAPSNVYQSASAQPLQLTVQTYNHQTGDAVGIFSGSVMDLNGGWQQVKDGRFRIRF